MDSNNIKSLRIISAIGIIAGTWSLIFEIYFFQKFAVDIYFARLIFTVIALSTFILSFKSIGAKTSNVLTHIFIISLISSFAFTIYKIPNTVYINSQILALLIFTTSIIFSWEIKNQIIVAIYYNLLFAVSIMYNDRNIYLLPNLFSLIIFVCLISSLSVAASFVTFNLRKKYSIRSEEIDFLFDSVPVGICRSDLHGTILTCNQYFISLLELSNSEQKINLIRYLKNNSFNDFFEKICLSDYAQDVCSIGHIKENGEILHLKIDAKKILNDTYKKSIEFIFSDETKDILAMQEREKANERILNEIKQREIIAQQALLEKKHKLELLAKINHEVRTPLNSILIYFEMIEDGYLKSLDEIKKYSKSVRTASQSLLQTINNFIDYVKIETGKMEVEKELFNLKEEVEGIILLLTPLAISKKNQLILSLENFSKNLAYSDSTKFRQIITNLIANSIKFTSDGIIKLTVHNKNNVGDDYEIIAIIEDTGPGIPAEKLNTIFDPFISLKDGDRSNYSSGLGLSICREFTNMLNGQISIESEVGKGTKFKVTLPYSYTFPKLIQ